MKLKTVLTATAAVLIAATQTSAAQTPTRMNVFNAWQTYSWPAENGKICFVISTPTRMTPNDVDHGENFFMVTQKPGEGVSYEPQAKMGYGLSESAPVTVDIDGKDFQMFAKGDGAWLENAAEEPQLVAAMRAGKTLTVEATSARGTETSYTYSLSGVTAALNSINDCK